MYIKILSPFLIVGIIFYIFLCAYVFFNQKSLIFIPSKNVFELPKYENLKEITIQTEDGVKLNAWFLDNKSDKTVLFFHGNAGNLFYNEGKIKLFNDLHLNAIMLDYRGYGKSEGSIEKEEDVYKDAEATYEYVINRGTEPKNIILWGQSLGGAVSIDLAQNKNVYAVVVESTFYSMDSMAHNQYWFLPTSLLGRYHFRSDKKITNIYSPILFIHSKNDEMINFSNSQKLFEKANEPKTFQETKGTHNGGLETSYNLYISAITKLLNQ